MAFEGNDWGFLQLVKHDPEAAIKYERLAAEMWKERDPSVYREMLLDNVFGLGDDDEPTMHPPDCRPGFTYIDGRWIYDENL